jgi:glutamate/tyrosine decarboxylase-like PLP-dependent enzyme
VALAKEFEQMVRSDDRFEVVAEVVCGLVCFRIKVRIGCGVAVAVARESSILQARETSNAAEPA